MRDTHRDRQTEKERETDRQKNGQMADRCMVRTMDDKLMGDRPTV